MTLEFERSGVRNSASGANIGAMFYTYNPCMFVAKTSAAGGAAGSNVPHVSHDARSE
jgi:hypothetical protein